MFIPDCFKMTDVGELRALMREYSFAALVTQGEGGVVATHLPLLFDADGGPQGALIGHMARENPQWRSIKGEALAIFNGPHTYISPTWYESPGTAPTWNYLTVHAYGTLELVEDPDGLHEILTRTVETYERDMPEPWSYDVNDPGVNRVLKDIVGFRLVISRLEGKAKLNQNHPEDRRRKVIRVLEARDDENSQAIAKLMAEALGD